MTLPKIPLDWTQEHKEYHWSYDDWQYDVNNGDTKLGYADWVARNYESFCQILPEDYEAGYNATSTPLNQD